MATKKKAPSTDAAPPAAATPTRKFPAGARKKKADAPVQPGDAGSESRDEGGATPVAAEAAPSGETDAPPGPSDEAIRARAWAIWRMYGGSPMQNWLRAEAELREEAAKG